MFASKGVQTDMHQDVQPGARAIAPTRCAGTRRRTGLLWISVLVLATFVAAALAPASAGMFTMSRSELNSMAKRMSLTSAQRPKVTSVANTLGKESEAIFKKYGVRPDRCAGIGPLRLSALNNEVSGAFSRAKQKLTGVLSAGQIKVFSSILNERRAATKRRVACGVQS